MTMPRGRAAGGVVAAIVLGVVLQLGLPLLPQRFASLVMAVVLLVLATFTAVGHAQQSRRSRGRSRVGWGLAGMISGLWAVTNVIYGTYAALGHTMLHPDISDYTATVAICGIPPTLIVLTPTIGGPWVRLRRFIDGATISAALAFLSWRTVVKPVLGLVVPQMRVMVGLAPTLEIIGCALALVALSRSRPRDGNALILMEASLVLFCAATLADVYNVSFFHPRYAHGVAGAYVCATAVLAISSRSALPGDASAQAASGEGRWGWLPYLPVGICFAAAAYLQLHDGTLDPVLFWVLLSTSVLVLARQFLNLQTNLVLLRRVDEQRERLSYLAFHDPLTGLANRAMLSDRADTVLADAGQDSVTALVLLDLDGFKAVNDTYGHAAGDELLVTVAARISRCVRDQDLVVRLGGDEFVVFMPGLEDAAESSAIGERILRELDQPVTIAGTEMLVRGSAGLAVAYGPVASPDGLLRDADVALYQAKAAGKNRLCLFPQALGMADEPTQDLPIRAT